MMKHIFHTLILIAVFSGARLEAAENLLCNPGFEDTLEPAWEKRTPEDASRKLYRAEGVGRSGDWAAVLENIQPAYTRLRQGDDRSIAVEPGSLLELSAWVKSELADGGAVMLQLYCMNQEEHIRAQPTSRLVRGPFDWTKMY
ncbi:MAG: hypothetical protein H8E44_29220, partial [Planctomycetes bacterium]|nr:hypothetical protein [Planctomycetota bacterium]